MPGKWFILTALMAFITTLAHAEDPPTLSPRGFLEPDTPAGDDEFGASYAAQGLRCVVGAPGDDGLGLDTGCIYIFHYVDGAWIQEAHITIPGLTGGERFGDQVAIYEDIVVASVGGLDGEGGWDADAIWIFQGVDPNADEEEDEEEDGIEDADADFDHIVVREWSDQSTVNSFGAPGFARQLGLSKLGLGALSDLGVHTWWLETIDQPQSRTVREGEFERFQIFDNSEFLLGAPSLAVWPTNNIVEITGWTTFYNEWAPSTYAGDSLDSLDAAAQGCCLEYDIYCGTCQGNLPYGSCDVTRIAAGGFVMTDRTGYLWSVAENVGEDANCYPELDWACITADFDHECTSDYQVMPTFDESSNDTILWQDGFLTDDLEKRRPYAGEPLGDHVLRVLMGAEYGTDHTLVYAGPADELQPVARIDGIGMSGQLFNAGVIAPIDGGIAWYLPHPDGDSDWDGFSDLEDTCPEYYNEDNEDCDGDGTGNACALDFEADQDCNENDILDGCEIFDGEDDCDGNGMPDACELEDQPALDYNEDGVIDRCCPDVVGDQGEGSYDGEVDTQDLLFFLQLWYLEDLPQIDFDESGSVTVFDLLILLEGWGTCDLPEDG